MGLNPYSITHYIWIVYRVSCDVAAFFVWWIGASYTSLQLCNVAPSISFLYLCNATITRVDNTCYTVRHGNIYTLWTWHSCECEFLNILCNHATNQQYILLTITQFCIIIVIISLPLINKFIQFISHHSRPPIAIEWIPVFLKHCCNFSFFHNLSWSHFLRSFIFPFRNLSHFTQ